MTLKRLAILLAILIFLAGVGIAWLWQYAYSPQGRARVIIAQLNDESTTLRGWLLKHHLVREGYTVQADNVLSTPPRNDLDRETQEYRNRERAWERRIDAAAEAMAKLGNDVIPVIIQELQGSKDGRSQDAKFVAARTSGRLHDPAAIEPLASWVRAVAGDNVGFDRALVHTEVTWTLVEIGAEPRAIPAIKKLLEDPEPEVRSVAAEALEELGIKRPPLSQPTKP
jgi:hypothetical protein